MDKPSQPSQSEPSPFSKLLSFFGINKPTDSAEELGHEIQELIEDGEEQGIISSQEGMMLSSIIDFRETLVSEIMTPRTAMVCAPSTASGSEIISLIIDNGFSRIPIYGESPDQIIGVLHAKVLLRYCSIDTDPPNAGDIVNPAFFVRENHKIVDLLKDFKSKKIHMAIVVDEFGSVRGIITFEDILEEIVGEIEDEYDQDDTRWTEVDENTVLTDAKIDIEELESFFQLELPDGPYESIGGLVIHLEGRLPATGDIIQMEDLSFKIISATNRQINTIQVQRTPK